MLSVGVEGSQKDRMYSEVAVQCSGLRSVIVITNYYFWT